LSLPPQPSSRTNTAAETQASDRFRFIIKRYAPPRMQSNVCGPTSRQTPGSEQPYAETMHAAHDGGWPPHASGTTTHVGLSVGSPMPPSIGNPPYCPKLTQISPGRHR